jgi:2-hydroxychromene-2-carboxylate isomerase
MDASFEPMALLALCGEQTTKNALKAVTEEAVMRGVFGTPTFFVGNEMFWGQDRIEWVREALTRDQNDN